MSLTHVDPHVSEIVMVWIQSGDLLMVWIQISLYKKGNRWLVALACSKLRLRLVTITSTHKLYSSSCEPILLVFFQNRQC